jgi:hypothetical protein
VRVRASPTPDKRTSAQGNAVSRPAFGLVHDGAGFARDR